VSAGKESGSQETMNEIHYKNALWFGFSWLLGFLIHPLFLCELGALRVEKQIRRSQTAATKNATWSDSLAPPQAKAQGRGVFSDQLFAIFRPADSPGNRDLPARRRRRTRIIRTIEGFALVASMSAPVAVLAVLGIVGRGIIGAGAVKKRAAEKKQDQFPFPEAA
jgi:hypothetical protein